MIHGLPKIGHFIRKTSLDELPQFWNVLKGDMSLVGTRPPTLDEYESYTPEQKRRLSFRPGITGLWQVSGRSEITDFDEMMKIIAKCDTCRLALFDDEFPYIIPLNFGTILKMDNFIYISIVLKKEQNLI